MPNVEDVECCSIKRILLFQRHHFSQTLSILNNDNCNIFENLSVPQYARIVSLIRDMIIATDMNQHLQVLPEERKYVCLEAYNPGIKYHRFLLLSLMMTCCDLNDQVKGWIYCRDIAVSNLDTAPFELMKNFVYNFQHVSGEDLLGVF